jgi:hypothetical protein
MPFAVNYTHLRECFPASSWNKHWSNEGLRQTIMIDVDRLYIAELAHLPNLKVWWTHIHGQGSVSLGGERYSTLRSAPWLGAFPVLVYIDGSI